VALTAALMGLVLTIQYVTTNGALYNYAFALTSGMDVLAAGDWLGWRDGGIAAGSGSNGHISLGADPNALTLGNQGAFWFTGGVLTR
jgi:hypothetical protein